MKAIKNIFQFIGVSIGAIFSSHAIATSAATATVLVGSGGLKFVPAITNIAVGDSVIWNWAGNNHSSTSGTNGVASGLWNSGVFSGTHSFTNTFTTNGTFAYYCSVHFASGMTGSVIVTNLVAPANIPPTVTITNPVSGIVLSAPASLTLAANAADSDGTVTNVQFLQGTTLLGNVAAAPFSIAVNNLAAATYTFSAIASDNGGATATNSILVHVINPNPVTIAALAIPSPNHFQFSYASDIGLSYIVQISTNLSGSWTTISTNSPATTNPTIFTDPNVNGSGAFYRVGRLPNP